VNPAAYKAAHYATFPPRLVEPLIKASTSEKGCCPECGAPWVRVTTEASGGAKGASWHAHDADDERGNFKVRSSKGYRPGSTAGWRPSCQCKTPKPVPQTVLDPFGGSGTVGLVADRLNRNAILCELKLDYGDQATKRITDDGPMFADIEIS
jgi:hypothetical protein